MSVLAQLEQGLAQASIDITPQQTQALIAYMQLISKWNKVHNLTAIREESAMLTLHLLDSLVVLPYLQEAKNLLDVGSGAGLPGIVIAICRPQLAVSVMDSNQKKVSFMRHVKATLQLDQLTVLSGRVEQMQVQAGYDIVISRAFSDLLSFIQLTQAAIRPTGRWMAMKGQLPHAELSALHDAMQLSPERIEKLHVPGLDAERHLLVFNAQQALASKQERRIQE